MNKLWQIGLSQNVAFYFFIKIFYLGDANIQLDNVRQSSDPDSAGISKNIEAIHQGCNSNPARRFVALVSIVFQVTSLVTDNLLSKEVPLHINCKNSKVTFRI